MLSGTKQADAASAARILDGSSNAAEHMPIPGEYMSGNLWRFSLRDNDVDAHGPLGSFIRRATTMTNPILHYVNTGRFPVKNLSDLRTEPTLCNILAHRRYLEDLLFEQRSLREWNRMISEQIIAESEQVHEQLSEMLAKMEANQQQNAWTRAQGTAANAATATCPNATLQVKPVHVAHLPNLRVLENAHRHTWLKVQK